MKFKFNPDDLKSLVKKSFSSDNINKRRQSMKFFWKNLPEQIRRLSVVAVILFALPLVVRQLLIPTDFGKYGHYRASALDEIVSQEIHYAGRELCNECHDDVVEVKYNGYHKTLTCEVCHGPAFAHTEDDAIELEAPRKRSYCPTCHEYLPSRPSGFPQIISARHNSRKACIKCHDPHDPKPPETPRECKACHAEISYTKAVSKHVDIPCTRCHQTPEEHKIRPREVLPSKPHNREFCGSCHALDAESSEDIPRIDLFEHERRYNCWQCHYPHLPEAN
ncbi:MAG TPA: hypothetical protein ENK44_09655 [Caldithrix abyssi]|uniref:Cytochrome c7-like domain-containing protein n=1 Tax=Caldithrix abyssi TaxID=187145 RepID=A0A7V4U0W2_CALAY|nr:hypothetical protein [Caldithrix abyssi]